MHAVHALNAFKVINYTAEHGNSGNLRVAFSSAFHKNTNFTSNLCKTNISSAIL